MAATSFITKMPTSGGGWAPVKVIEADITHATQWDRDIQQPWIAPTDRIDAGWSWRLIYLRSSLLELATTRHLAYLQLVTPDAQGNAWPLGQVLLVDGYPFPPNRRRHSVFLWYLAGTPAGALQAAGAAHCKGVMAALLDCAVQFSRLRGYRGRTCLHASPAGTASQQKELFERYQAAGLNLVDGNYISPVRRNDGRYFYADEAIADNLSAKLHAWR